ncbi:MAG: helix-turn-helix domain-containing protein [Clostridiaceae bacterium]|jgi:DNA-binding XRE family transcriptional regulator|nr:helix-turn-helix domain-containing protein [Clostridiaceae bacterium]
MYEVDGLGIRIAQLRKEKDMTQEAFARSLGVSPQAVSKWETGIGYPDITLLPQIAKELGVSIDQLFGKNPGSEESQAKAFPFPKTRGSLKLMGSLGGIACYADMPGKQEKSMISFDDSSEVNLETQTIINRGKNRITLVYAEEYEISGEEIAPDEYNYSDDKAAGKKEEDPGFSYSDPGFSYSGDYTKTETAAQIDSYDIFVLGSCKVLIIHDENEKQRWLAEGTPDFMRMLKVEQLGSTLKISVDQIHKSIFKSRKIKGQITLYAPMINMNRIAVNLRGSGDLISQVNFEESDLQISGAGDLRMAKCGLTEVKISGAGDFYATEAHDAKISIAGSGDVTIDRVSGKYLCKIAGAGDVDFRAGELENLSVRIVGAGDLDAAEVTVGDLDISIQGGGDAVIGCVTGKSVEKLSLGSSLKILNRS